MGKIKRTQRETTYRVTAARGRAVGGAVNRDRAVIVVVVGPLGVGVEGARNRNRAKRVKELGEEGWG